MKLAARKTEKRDAPSDNNSKTKSKSGGQKSGLTKSLRAAFTTKAQMGDLDATHLVETVIGTFPSDSSDDDTQ